MRSKSPLSLPFDPPHFPLLNYQFDGEFNSQFEPTRTRATWLNWVVLTSLASQMKEINKTPADGVQQPWRLGEKERNKRGGAQGRRILERLAANDNC
jgi:hypothetical protein